MSGTTIPPGEVIMPAEIDARFADGSLFKRSAYRLELLDEYDSPRTRLRVARFLVGEPEDAEIRAYWDRIVVDARQAGASMTRVHVIAEPLTDYLRFELDFYRRSVLIGEDIRILPVDRAGDVDLPGFDYWLFDDRRVAVMYYGDRGSWLRAEMVADPDFVAACRRWRDAALAAALPLAAYMERSETT